MKVQYFEDTVTLCIDLSGSPSVGSREISEGIVLDYDAVGKLVGIYIDNASHKVEFNAGAQKVAGEGGGGVKGKRYCLLWL